MLIIPVERMAVGYSGLIPLRPANVHNRGFSTLHTGQDQAKAGILASTRLGVQPSPAILARWTTSASTASSAGVGFLSTGPFPEPLRPVAESPSAGRAPDPATSRSCGRRP